MVLGPASRVNLHPLAPAGPSTSHGNTMTVVEGIVLACARCGSRIGELLVEIRADSTIARVRLDEEC